MSFVGMNVLNLISFGIALRRYMNVVQFWMVFYVKEIQWQSLEFSLFCFFSFFFNCSLFMIYFLLNFPSYELLVWCCWSANLVILSKKKFISFECIPYILIYSTPFLPLATFLIVIIILDRHWQTSVLDR